MNWIADLKNLQELQEPCRDSAPRGLVARVTLRMNNQAVSNDMCWDCGCRERLAICSLCSHWVCDQHRILVGAVNLDDDGRSLGGVNIMCANAGKCNDRQVWVIGALGKGVSISGKVGKQLQLAYIVTSIYGLTFLSPGLRGATRLEAHGDYK